MIVGVYHPYANAGGGGERVLFSVLKALAVMMKKDPMKVVIYTGDVESAEEIFAKAERIFGIKLDSDLYEFVYLKHRKWIEQDTWTHFTVLG